MKNILISLAALLVLATACGPQKESSKPAVSGAPGEMMVVITKAQWEGEAGSALRDVLADGYPYLPQKEPMFNLVNIPASGVNNLIKTHRNMLYLQIADTCSTGIKVRRDVWSAPQTMAIVSAPDELSAAQYIRENGERLVEVFENAERERNIGNAKLFEEKESRLIVEDAFGGSPVFPKGYSVKKQTKDFIWISYETATTIQGILIYRFPYRGNYQFTPAALIDKRNEVTREQVPAQAEGSYMIANPNIIPGYKLVSYNGISRREIRSLWDTQGDFMGGPFVSHAFLSRDGQEILVVEGFVYAAKHKKRNYLRQVEAIVASFRWKE